MLRAYKTSKSRWAIRGPEGVSRFAGRAQAAEDALGTAKKAAISLVSLSGPRFERPTLVEQMEFFVWTPQRSKSMQ